LQLIHFQAHDLIIFALYLHAGHVEGVFILVAFG
jgi:hypothetical protein